MLVNNPELKNRFLTEINVFFTVHGSSISLVSTASSLYSSAEEKQAHEIRKLRRELTEAQEKVHTLTSQLSTNVSNIYINYLFKIKNHLLFMSYFFNFKNIYKYYSVFFEIIYLSSSHLSLSYAVLFQ